MLNVILLKYFYYLIRHCVFRGGGRISEGTNTGGHGFLSACCRKAKLPGTLAGTGAGSPIGTGITTAAFDPPAHPRRPRPPDFRDMPVSRQCSVLARPRAGGLRQSAPRPQGGGLDGEVAVPASRSDTCPADVVDPSARWDRAAPTVRAWSWCGASAPGPRRRGESRNPWRAAGCHFQKSTAYWVRSGLHRVRSGLHWESSGADTRFQGGYLLLRSARGEAGGRAGAVRLLAGVVILVQVLGTHTGHSGRVALRVGGLGAVGLGNTERSDEYARVLPDCHVTGRLCDKAGPCWVRPRSCHLLRHVSCVLQRSTLRLM
jgi:hypothetical protein